VRFIEPERRADFRGSLPDLCERKLRRTRSIRVVQCNVFNQEGHAAWDALTEVALEEAKLVRYDGAIHDVIIDLRQDFHLQASRRSGADG
jgi:dTDP-4-dehydrorhamnose 3,5-epimerase-like enzyme